MKFPVHSRLSSLLAIFGLQAHILVERSPSRGAGPLTQSDQAAASNVIDLFSGAPRFDQCTRQEVRKGGDVVFVLGQHPVTGVVIETAGPTIAVVSYRDPSTSADKLSVIQQDPGDMWHSVSTCDATNRDDALAHARRMPKRDRCFAGKDVDVLDDLSPSDMRSVLRSIGNALTGEGDKAAEKRQPRDVLESILRYGRRFGFVSADQQLRVARDHKGGKKDHEPSATTPATTHAESTDG